MSESDRIEGPKCMRDAESSADLVVRERAALIDELSPAFDLFAPRAQTSPFIFCSPHSGRVYPSTLLTLSRLDGHALRKSEDCYVDELFARVTAHGAPLIAARFPRAYLDVNREPYELDPLLFLDPLPPFANARSLRVVGGLGTIARIVADQEEIYRTRLPLAVGLERIERLYWPFHQALGALIAKTRAQFGVAILIDCHSMPSAASIPSSAQRPHIVLGDRFGTACDPRLTRFVRDRFSDLGYDVQLNRPYAGGFITEHYGRPGDGVHTLQIEINRALYLDETALTRTRGFDRLAGHLERIATQLAAEYWLPVSGQAAAE